MHLPYYKSCNFVKFFRLLHQAALWDNAELLEDLLNGDEIKCLDSRDSWGRTALHAAATNPGARCLRILAQAGADLDACMGPRGEGMNIAIFFITNAIFRTLLMHHRVLEHI